MKTNKLIIIAVLTVVLAACGAGSKKSNDMEKRTQVKIETTMGNIVVELYNETPKHRDNFIKLAKEGVYDSTLFHRVIKAFMIQAGDPDSKTANDTAQLGGGDVGYTVPAEFVSKFFHKKGALAAARMGDDVNPERASSGCQFYIVTGRKFSESQLLNMEGQKNNTRIDEIFIVCLAHLVDFFHVLTSQFVEDFIDSVVVLLSFHVQQLRFTELLSGHDVELATR